MAGKGSGQKTGGKTESPAKPLTSKNSVSCIVKKVTVTTLCDSLNQLKISLGQTPDQQQKPDSVDTGEQGGYKRSHLLWRTGRHTFRLNVCSFSP